MRYLNGNATRVICGMFICLMAADSMAQSPNMDVKPASEATLAAQAKMRASLPADNGRDEEFASRGFIATRTDPLIKAKDGHVVWDINAFDWVKGDAPTTVNPSLWRQSKLIKHNGLFKVADGVWQVRGLDMSNMTVVEGKTGWIIIDPLITTETATAAIALVNEHLGNRPVTAVIYSHAHVDHFGGVRALVAPDGNTPIVAPEGFMAAAINENVLTLNLIGRRAAYQFAEPVKNGPQGNVGGGLSGLFPHGTSTLIPPTDYIQKTGDRRILDGVTFEFQMVPNTESPAEMNFYLPERKTLFVSEFAIGTMHNVQTPRGAPVRDALKWAGYLTELLDRYGDTAEAVMFGHTWPRFGNDAVRTHLRLQRDSYKFIHDQTVRLMNNGETPTEIAEELKMPTEVGNEWSTRGYYGTVRHNAKGVYQFYVGWWDGIPAHLNMYPPAEQGKRYVAAMGGAGKVIREAKKAMAKGDYRWSAELLNHLVFAEPGNRPARALLADSYEQLGYQAESAIWRNNYLTGALELRNGVAPRVFQSAPAADMVNAMPTESFLDMLAGRLNPDRIGDRSMSVVANITDTKETSLISVRNAVLVGQMNKTVPNPNVTVSGTRNMLMRLFLAKEPLEKLEANGLRISGDISALLALQAAIETPLVDYPIVTP